MAFSKYTLCDLPGDATNAVRSVNQEISNLIADIDNDINSASVSFEEANTAVNALMDDINALLVQADASVLRGVNRFTDTLGLLSPVPTISDDEKRLSLLGFAAINGTVLLQCAGSNVEEIRSLVKLVGLEEAERIIRAATPGDKIIVYTKTITIEVNTGSNVAPSLEYINTTYNLNITEENITYVSNGLVISLSDITNLSAAEPITAVIEYESLIGVNISIQAAQSKGGDISLNKLNIYIFSLCGGSTTSQGRALFTTYGFDASLINSSTYKIRIKVNNTDIYEIDITGNNGVSLGKPYTLESIAASINWQLKDIDVYPLNNELVFRTARVGVTASIEFNDAVDSDASRACGILQGLHDLFIESFKIKRENVKIAVTKDITYDATNTGVNVTISNNKPNKISDLPQIIIRGGNNQNICSILTRQDILRFRSLGFTNSQIATINQCVRFADINPNIITNSIDQTNNTYNEIIDAIDGFENYTDYNSVQNLVNRLLKLSNLSLERFQATLFAFNFICIKITDITLFQYMQDYRGVSDSDLDTLFNSRDDITCIDTSVTDLEIGQKINDLLNIPPGSTALSSKKLNIPVTQDLQNKQLIKETHAQLLDNDNSIKDINILLNKGTNLNTIRSKLQKVLKKTTTVQSSLSGFDTTYNTVPTNDRIKGYRSFDSPASLLFRSMNPSKTFNITNEVSYIIDASSILNGDTSGTHLLLGSISSVLDYALKNYSRLNERLQGLSRSWWGAFEASTSVISNLLGDGVYDSSVLKCAFGTMPSSDLSLNLSLSFSTLNTALEKVQTAITSIIAIFGKIINQLLCKIQLLIDKLNTDASIDNAGGGAVLFHCEASLRIGLNPALVTLISDIASKFSVLLLLPKVSAVNLRVLSLSALNSPLYVSSITDQINTCQSDLITQFFGSNGEITEQATEALDSFGDIFSLPSSLTEGFSLSNPPENISDLLQKPTISKPRQPKI